MEKYTRFIRGICQYCQCREFFIVKEDVHLGIRELECRECGAGGAKSTVRFVDKLFQSQNTKTK